MEARHQSDLARLKAKVATRETAGKVAAEGVQLAVESHALQKEAEDEEERARSGPSRRLFPSLSFRMAVAMHLCSPSSSAFTIRL